MSNSQNPVFFSYPVTGEIDLLLAKKRDKEKHMTELQWAKRERERERERGGERKILFFFFFLLASTKTSPALARDTLMLKSWEKILRMMRECVFFFFSSIKITTLNALIEYIPHKAKLNLTVMLLDLFDDLSLFLYLLSQHFLLILYGPEKFSA